MQQILDAILANASAEEFAALEVPASYFNLADPIASLLFQIMLSLSCHRRLHQLRSKAQ